MSDDVRRQNPIEIAWQGDLCGHLRINGETWAEVEWSEKRQAWCIQDAEGRCLTHKHSIHAEVGASDGKDAAVELAGIMIRDGRMPDPATARRNHEERLQKDRERREKQPAYQRRQAEREEKRRKDREVSDTFWEAEEAEESEIPLYEVLAETFDFADPDIWKSNSFASMRPRLIVHVRHAIAKLERFGYAFGRGTKAEQLDRAREILKQLESPP